MPRIKNDLFLRACRRQGTPRTPVWIMRQAGRYLPSYRKLRERYDFLALCRSPELAVQVTLLPVYELGVDAAIIFSDIMVLPEAMGMELQLVESVGPVLASPVRTSHRVDELEVPDPSKKLGYVMESLAQTKEELAGRVPLIGFSGSPWTLFCYMVEGRGSKDFTWARRAIYTDPTLARKLLAKIADAVTLYLRAQAEAGADALQIFDTWGGLLGPDGYREFSLAYSRRVVEGVSDLGVPVILFARGAGSLLAEVAQAGCQVVGLDWQVDLGQARELVGTKAALQGNLDPVALYASVDAVRAAAAAVLSSYGEGAGHIFNLGHGIPPDVPVENVKALVEFVKEESRKYHRVPER